MRGLTIIEFGQPRLDHCCLGRLRHRNLIYQLSSNLLISTTAERNWHYAGQIFLILVELSAQPAIHEFNRSLTLMARE